VNAYAARVVWRGGKEDIRAHTVHVADQAIPASCAEDRGGDPSKADPEQLLVASLSACHMLWFLDFCRRERLRVRSYEDDAEGTMNETRFTRVVLRPRVEFETDVAPELLDELHHRAHEACFIANSVSCPVEVAPR
jgi:organic hydroperoxide reductase OsmC/OhrA